MILPKILWWVNGMGNDIQISFLVGKLNEVKLMSILYSIYNLIVKAK
jgi:hypothetical protein